MLFLRPSWIEGQFRYGPLALLAYVDLKRVVPLIRSRRVRGISTAIESHRVQETARQCEIMGYKETPGRRKTVG